jgi:hypothetical protein
MWVTDHLIVPDESTGVYGTIAEALVSLGFLAGRTRRLELGVSALPGVARAAPAPAGRQAPPPSRDEDRETNAAQASGWGSYLHAAVVRGVSCGGGSDVTGFDLKLA